MSPMLLLFVALQGPSPIGELKKAQWIEKVKGWGYTLAQKQRSNELQLIDKGVTITLAFGFRNADAEEGARLICYAHGSVAFVFPAMVPRTDLAGWVSKELSGKTIVRSFLDGVLSAESPILISPLDQEGEVKARLANYCRDLSALAGLAAKYKGTPSPDSWARGSAPLDERAAIDCLYEHDVAAIVHLCHWERKTAFGFSGSGWVVPATVDGIDIVVRGNDPAVSKAPCTISWSHRVDPNWQKQWMLSAGQNIRWANVVSTPGQLEIDCPIPISASTTVGDVKNRILWFVSQIKSLGP